MERSNINEIVGLLGVYSPEKLDTLRLTYPEFSNLLKPGTVCGDGNEIDGLSRFLTEVAADGMRQGIELCDQVLPLLNRKLVLAGKLRFTSQLVTVLAGASIFTLLAQSNGYAKAAKYISAGLVLIGTILPLVAQYVEAGWFHGGDSLRQLYDELVECKVEACHILPHLEFCLRSNLSQAATEQVSKANGLSLRIRKGIQRTSPANI